MDSILDTVKVACGVEITETAFDSDLIIHTNSALADLNQLGVGPSAGFVVIDSTQTWTDFLGEVIDLEQAKSYVVLFVKLLFDPPASSTIVDSYNRSLTNMGLRLKDQVEFRPTS